MKFHVHRYLKKNIETKTKYEYLLNVRSILLVLSQKSNEPTVQFCILIECFPFPFPCANCPVLYTSTLLCYLKASSPFNSNIPCIWSSFGFLSLFNLLLLCTLNSFFFVSHHHTTLKLKQKKKSFFCVSPWFSCFLLLNGLVDKCCVLNIYQPYASLISLSSLWFGWMHGGIWFLVVYCFLVIVKKKKILLPL